ncbi:MAG: hypothetical protein AAF614_34255 [Chloroflexota bacterium]
MLFNEHEWIEELDRQIKDEPNAAAFKLSCEDALLYGDEMRLIVNRVTVAELLTLCGGWMWQLVKDDADSK